MDQRAEKSSAVVECTAAACEGIKKGAAALRIEIRETAALLL